LTAPWGRFPDVSRVDHVKDLVLPWNGTTSGVKAPDGDWIAADRQGLVICDATSAAFAMLLPWDRLDVVTFSFQKALGGEAGLGVAALSPRAIERLDRYTPPRPVPKVLRLRSDQGFERALATGSMINTFSVWTLEDWIDGVEWGLSIGGLKALVERTEANAAALDTWVRKTDWIDYLAADPSIRSTTSVCLKFVDPRVSVMDEAARQALVKRI